MTSIYDHINLKMIKLFMNTGKRHSAKGKQHSYKHIWIYHDEILKDFQIAGAQLTTDYRDDMKTFLDPLHKRRQVQET